MKFQFKKRRAERAHTAIWSPKIQTTWEEDRNFVGAAVDLRAQKFKYLTRSLFLKSLQLLIQLLTTVINAEWVSGWLVGTSPTVYFPTQSFYAQESTSSRKNEGPVSEQVIAVIF